MKKVFVTGSADETRALGKKLATTLKAGDVIGLSGELGTGKTVFSQGVAAGLGVKQKVTSASFVIVQKFTRGRLPFYHLDFYRLSSQEILEGGFLEILDEAGISVIEWSEKIKDFLPPKTILVEFEFISDKKRRIKIKR